MTESKNILEARNQLSKLVAAAASGSDTIIAKRGVPVARLTAVAQEPPHTAGGLARWLGDNGAPDVGRRGVNDLDAQIAGEREGWE
ncbi:type II toxin-antitoxin system Phd/YefM family antitoxin [Rathayibacter soli]|uniref:type II toxin-antitoxin system Phd/YefM family antitoxin n=1 Tax=Rathayibacter soli TaxID=3144168 RepID=UPI0027E570E1|nr:type II toxin-antitoxin system prevent-host-death family antitoxin [Glaciibacter superstes]